MQKLPACEGRISVEGHPVREPTESMQTGGGLTRSGYGAGSRDEGELVSKLVWQVKLVAELEPGVVTETELARIERDAQASVADLGLRLGSVKNLGQPACLSQVDQPG